MVQMLKFCWTKFLKLPGDSLVSLESYYFFESWTNPFLSSAMENSELLKQVILFYIIGFP